jgi:hypothetical protein
LSELEGDDGGKRDGGEEGVGGSVLAHGDTSPILDAAKHDLDSLNANDKCRWSEQRGW